MNKTNNAKNIRTKNLRYKKPALQTLGYELMSSELYDIQDACSEVTWFAENNDDTLLNALDGDDEAEFEFRMAFSELEGKIERFNDAIRDSYVREYFDICTVGLIGNRYNTLGYDALEEDYFSLTSYEQALAHTESGEKLMRLTKAEMISIIGNCLGTLIAFLDIRHSFDYLKATFDILKDENTSILKIIKDIDIAYEAANEANFDKYKNETGYFLQLIQNLPNRLWLE